MLEQEPSSPVTIEHKRPSDIPPYIYESLGLLDLMQGYGFTDGLFEQAFKEYGDEGDEKHIFLAMQDGKAVGSLVVKVSHSIDTDDGKLFPALYDLAPHIAARIADATICNVSGVLKRDDTTEKGLADRFYRQMNEMFDPTIVVGRTKNPDAVLARANSLGRLEYRSWYGNTEVTPPPEKNKVDLHDQQPLVPIEAVRLAYTRSKFKVEDNPDASYHKERLGSEGEMYVDPGILLPEIKDARTYPPYIQAAYQAIIRRQQSEHILSQRQNREEQTVVLPLISIRIT